MRVFEVPEPVGPWVTVLVYLPRNRFTAELPERVADAVADAYGAEQRTFESHVGASSLARIAVSVPLPGRAAVGRPRGARAGDRRAVDVVVGPAAGGARRRGRRGRAAGRCSIGSARTPRRRTAPPCPLSRAISDVRRIAALLAGDAELTTSLGHDVDAPAGEWRFRVYRRASRPRCPSCCRCSTTSGCRRSTSGRTRSASTTSGSSSTTSASASRPASSSTNAAAPRCRRPSPRSSPATIESDGFNRLVLRAGLSAREVAIVRAYGKYLRQIGFAFSQPYIEDTLCAHPRSSPTSSSCSTPASTRRASAATPGERRGEMAGAVPRAVEAALDAIPSLDDDRICRAFLTLIDATVRTNYYRDRRAIAVQARPDGDPRSAAAAAAPRDLGVRAAGRGRPPARRRHRPRRAALERPPGGLPHRGARADEGADGEERGHRADRRQGRLRRQAPAGRVPTSCAAEVVECYRAFIRGLLDLTDNIVAPPAAGAPRSCTRPTPSSTTATTPYLVVAADKGTATFSDIANEISAEYGFWLGDAFASGGSAGYDHKAMGITARGAWESVRRHASVLGKDADADPLTVGRHRRHVRRRVRQRDAALAAAATRRRVRPPPRLHRPRPGPGGRLRRAQAAVRAAAVELGRLRPDAASRAGGGVYPRSLKSIELSPQARAALGAPEGPLTPNELVSAVLRAPVDLLWNGGIGTYVKATSETNADVGDRANDGVRVNGAELRCRMVGEGGNLGFTQLGRVEYALGGGLVYTDAIDNSAGVDCSDHEVNIKILLDGVVDAGELTAKQRNELLESMTDEVAELVLDNNKAQTLALVIARRQALPMVNVHARYIDVLETEGWLDREPRVPADRQADRRAPGGRAGPAGARVRRAHRLHEERQRRRGACSPTCPTSHSLEADLLAYFPPSCASATRDAIRQHPLRREIIATAARQPDGQPVGDLVRPPHDRGHRCVRRRRDAGVGRRPRGARLRRSCGPRSTPSAATCRSTSSSTCSSTAGGWPSGRRCGCCATAARRSTSPRPSRSSSPGSSTLARSLEPVLVGRMADVVQSVEASRLTAGVPEDLAERAGVWPLLHTGFDLVEVAGAHGRDVDRASPPSSGRCSTASTCMWLWDGIGALPRSDRWQTQARSAVRDDLLTALAELTTTVIDSAGGSRRQLAATPTSARSPGRRRCSPRSAAPRATT